jgi:Tol biopolymer transport system component
MGADGGHQRRLTDDPADDVSPRWSADGSKLLFVSNRDGDYEIFVMNADGSGLTQLTDDEEDEALPAWQPRPVAT